MPQRGEFLRAGRRAKRAGAYRGKRAGRAQPAAARGGGTLSPWRRGGRGEVASAEPPHALSSPAAGLALTGNFIAQRCRERRAPPRGERLQGDPRVGTAPDPTSSGSGCLCRVPSLPASLRAGAVHFWAAKEGAGHAKGLRSADLHPLPSRSGFLGPACNFACNYCFSLVCEDFCEY